MSKIIEAWRDNPKAWGSVVIAFVIVVAGLILLGVDFFKVGTWNERGDMGDFWGGHLSAACNMAAFLIMFAALLMQSRELQLQRQELKDSREIFTQQKNAQEAQVRLSEETYEREGIMAIVRLLRSVVQEFYECDLRIYEESGDTHKWLHRTGTLRQNRFERQKELALSYLDLFEYLEEEVRDKSDYDDIIRSAMSRRMDVFLVDEKDIPNEVKKHLTPNLVQLMNRILKEDFFKLQ